MVFILDYLKKRNPVDARVEGRLTINYFKHADHLFFRGWYWNQLWQFVQTYQWLYFIDYLFYYKWLMQVFYKTLCFRIKSTNNFDFIYFINTVYTSKIFHCSYCV